MPLSEDEIPSYYQHCYENKPGSAQYGRWRELCAVGKADHVIELAGKIGCDEPGVLAEVGCGDGSVLAELGRRGFGRERVGLEISRSGAELAARHREITRVEVFDGLSIDAEDDAYDLSFATHVLEHVIEPRPLLREMMRCSKAVIIEVPLENNLSARRPAARGTSDAIGHVQRFDRGQIRRLVEGLGWQIRAELLDPLPLEVHMFERRTALAKAKGASKWAIRRGAATVPAAAARLFTMHYGVAATEAAGNRAL